MDSGCRHIACSGSSEADRVCPNLSVHLPAPLSGLPPPHLLTALIWLSFHNFEFNLFCLSLPSSSWNRLKMWGSKSCCPLQRKLNKMLCFRRDNITGHFWNSTKSNDFVYGSRITISAKNDHLISLVVIKCRSCNSCYFEKKVHLLYLPNRYKYSINRKCIMSSWHCSRTRIDCINSLWRRSLRFMSSTKG